MRESLPDSPTVLLPSLLLPGQGSLLSRVEGTGMGVDVPAESDMIDPMIGSVD